MTERDKFISIIKKSLHGVLPCNQVDRLAERIADGLVLNGAKIEGGDCE